MKKIKIIFLLLFLSVSCFSADFRVIKDSKLYDGDYNFVETIENNSIVQLWDCSIQDQRNNNKLDFDYSVRLNINGKKRLMDASAIIPADTIDLFDNNLISHKLKEKGKYWTTKNTLEILKSKSRNIFYQMNKELIEVYESHRGIYDELEWYDGVQFNEHFINNLFIIIGDGIKYDFKYFIKKIEKKTNGYTIYCELDDTIFQKISYQDIQLEKLKETKEIEYNLIQDGDYLYFYSDTNQLIFTLLLIDKSVAEQYEILIKTNKCDLSKVTWPRHADGSCDYDRSKTTETTQTEKIKSSTNVVTNKTMTVSENLKLRSGEATSTQVLAVMQAGTKVKILELGKAETIDGINSNWVKVEVQTGAKDRDGKPIKAGTVGWCYGGYLK